MIEFVSKYDYRHIFSLDHIQSSSIIDNVVRQNAVSTVVQIKTKQTFGSGIIIQKNNNIYTIVTNRHVVKNQQDSQIKTPDNYVYHGILGMVSNQDDLAILKFTSDRLYSVAKMNTAPLEIDDSLIAAGFPFNSNQLQITAGKLSLQTIKPLQQGYQLGYSNKIEKGMSGGAIFNSLGEVVGVNGRSANPIIPDYQYQDTTYPSEQLQQRMVQLSWGIPIVNAIKLLADY